MVNGGWWMHGWIEHGSLTWKSIKPFFSDVSQKVVHIFLIMFLLHLEVVLRHFLRFFEKFRTIIFFGDFFDFLSSEVVAIWSFFYRVLL